MVVALADYRRANSWLDGRKIKFESNDACLQEADNAADLIRSRLYVDFDEDTIDAWDIDDADNQPPGIIQRLASMFMAAQLYKAKYSEDSIGKSGFGEALEADAFKILELLEKQIFRIKGLASKRNLSRNEFWPNSTTETRYPRNAEGDGQEVKFRINSVTGVEPTAVGADD